MKRASHLRFSFPLRAVTLVGLALLLPRVAISRSGRQQQGDSLASYISGHIHNADTGQPISHAVVSLSSAPIPGVPFAEPLSVFTGSDGGYKFDDLSPGLYTVLADGGPFSASGHSRGINLAGGQFYDSVDLKLEPTGIVSGSVTNRHGDPVPGVFVQVVYPDSSPRSFGSVPVMTDGQGAFRMGELKPGDCTLAVAFDQLGTPAVAHPGVVSFSSTATVSVKAGIETAGVRIGLPEMNNLPVASAAAPGSVSGKVVSSDTNAPIKNALVVLHGLGKATPTASKALLFALTGEDGTYKIPSVEAGDYRLTANAAGYTTASSGFSLQHMTVESEPVNDVETRLLPAAAISGVVKDADGSPIWLMSVIVYRIDGTGQVQAGVAVTDVLGNFRAVVPSPGNYYVRVGPPPMGGQAQLGYSTKYYPNEDTAENAQPIQIKPGVAVPGLQFTLPVTPTFTISVKIKANSGDPNTVFLYSMAKKNAVQPSMQRMPVASVPRIQFAASESTVYFRGVPAGTYTVSIRRANVTRDATGKVVRALGTGDPIGSVDAHIAGADVDVEVPVSDAIGAQTQQ